MTPLIITLAVLWVLMGGVISLLCSMWEKTNGWEVLLFIIFAPFIAVIAFATMAWSELRFRRYIRKHEND